MPDHSCKTAPTPSIPIPPHPLVPCSLSAWYLPSADTLCVVVLGLMSPLPVLSPQHHLRPPRSLLDTLHCPITATASYFLKKSLLKSYQKPSMMFGSLNRKEIPAAALPTTSTGYPQANNEHTRQNCLSNSLSWQQQPRPKAAHD